MILGAPSTSITVALASAALFGASTPLAKRLLGPVDPWLLAGLLYLGSGVGLFAIRRLSRAPSVRLQPGEAKWLVGAIIAGGIVAPVLLLFGLRSLPASNASLLLNAESVFTALIAWFVFRENFDRRIALGMLLIVGGAVALSWPTQVEAGPAIPWAASAAVLLACAGWAIDNNLTRRVALSDASFIAMTKGLVAGGVNTAIAFVLGAAVPSWPTALSGAVVGFAGYGLSLVLFIRALRDLGTARTAAYFSVAPFIGALIAIPLLDEAVTWMLVAGGALMALGVWLHLTERHEHAHTHEAIEHEHEHVHDIHHQHPHVSGPAGAHVHRHRHEPLTHTHPHYPDAHHRHPH